MLPGPGATGLILLEGIHTDGQQTGIAIRAQTQVNIVETTGGGHGGQPAGHAASQFDVALHIILAGVVIEKHQIQVRGVANFLAAQLAVGDDGKAGRGVVFRAQAAGARQRPGTLQRLGQHHIGQGRELVGQCLYRQHALQILSQQLEGDLVLPVAHHVHLLFDISLAIGQAAGVQIAAHLLGQGCKVRNFH